MTPPLDDLFSYLENSPTPFHAVEQSAARLRGEGFIHLKEEDAWDLQAGGKYYVIRGGGSLIAWVQGKENRFYMVGAHTDSPGLKIKPHPDYHKEGFHALRIEVYGSPLLYTWFDRELSIAGRLDYLRGESPQSLLIDFKKPLAIIPSLAIHLNREANKGWKINPQTELIPILTQVADEEKQSFEDLLLGHLGEFDSAATEILDYDLFCYPCQKPSLAGLEGEFILSARLDNLISCFAGQEALIQAQPQATSLLVLNDHEEVGSGSYTGAGGPFLRQVLGRIAGSEENLVRAISQSLLVSCDNAHGIHPNYADKHDPNHGPKMNEGPVIKHNANQRYATHAGSAGNLAHLAKQAGVPLQRYSSRSDVGCGSTIGPITASGIGISTVDIGVASLAMHSTREMAGAKDLNYLIRLLEALYNQV